MKSNAMPQRSIFTQWIFDRLPSAEKKRVLDGKAGVMNPKKTHIRIQCYLPAEVYTVAAAFGAFQSSESDFFTTLVNEYIDKRAKDRGIASPLGL